MNLGRCHLATVTTIPLKRMTGIAIGDGKIRTPTTDLDLGAGARARERDGQASWEGVDREAWNSQLVL
jgi:hypothetical protein